MSPSSENMMKLMAYADGELEGAELEEAQKLLASDPDSVRFVEQIAGLGDVVARGYDEGAGKTVARFDVADAVMASVGPAAKQNNVSSLDAAREKAAEKGREKRGNGVKIGAGIAAALALAASLFLFAQHRTDEAPMAGNDTPAVQGVQPGTVPAAVSSTGGSGVTVSTVNSPGNAVSVFYLPTANELSTSVVVWVDETGEK